MTDEKDSFLRLRCAILAGFLASQIWRKPYQGKIQMRHKLIVAAGQSNFDSVIRALAVVVVPSGEFDPCGMPWSETGYAVSGSNQAGSNHRPSAEVRGDGRSLVVFVQDIDSANDSI
jgi:hypothetical protein